MISQLNLEQDIYVGMDDFRVYQMLHLRDIMPNLIFKIHMAKMDNDRKRNDNSTI
jgi:hypothetical protein